MALLQDLVESQDEVNNTDSGSSLCEKAKEARNAHTVYPRSYDGLFKSILHGQPLWQRPPDDICTRCVDYEAALARQKELQSALASTPRGLNAEHWAAVLVDAGGLQAAHQEQRALVAAVEDLKQHVTWLETARPYAMSRCASLRPGEVMIWLDYGGFQDSAKGKMNVWCATLIRPGLQTQPVHVDFFFDAPNQGTDRDGFRKNGDAGVYFLDQLLNPAHHPGGLGESLLQTLCPDTTNVILSGDTGNGYRAYVMLEFLSSVHDRYGFAVELIPLAPGHAWNPSDHRIACMGHFITKVKKSARLIGAEMTAKAFSAMTDPTTTSRRKYMRRTHVYFRIVDLDGLAVPARGPLGWTMDNPIGGGFGVRKLLYFRFWFTDPEAENPVYPMSCAAVRAHGSMDMADNPTLVYSWKTALAKSMCQPCSNREVTPTQHEKSEKHTGVTSDPQSLVYPLRVE